MMLACLVVIGVCVNCNLGMLSGSVVLRTWFWPRNELQKMTENSLWKLVKKPRKK